MEEVKIVKYKNNYLKSSIELVKATWNLHSEFVDIPSTDIVYEYFFRVCLNWNRHLDIIINQDDEVKGILFGSIENESFIKERQYYLEDKKINKWLMKNLKNGAFGDRKIAEKVLGDMNDNDLRGEAYAHVFDSEINLFLVSPELRGKGLGRKLMDNYIVFCRKNSLKRAFLWTDTDCSYTFYEKYGFELYKRFDEACNNKKNSGMIFFYKVS